MLRSLDRLACGALLALLVACPAPLPELLPAPETPTPPTPPEPQIVSVQPRSGYPASPPDHPGTELTLELDEVPAGLTRVFFGNVEAREPSREGDRIRLRVPAGAASGPTSRI